MNAVRFDGGRVYTADPLDLFAETVVIDDGVVVYVGDADSAPSAAETVRLDGRMVMPGIHDAHTHLMMSGLKFTDEARVEAFASPEHIVAQLEASHRCAREDGWLVAGEVFVGPETAPGLTRAHLDEAFADTPVYIHDYSAHHAIVNSAALHRAGVSDETPDESGGAYRRDDQGRLNGQLIEHATWPVQRVIPRRPAEVYRDAVRWAQEVCHRFGITSVQEASASRETLDALAALEENGDLALHVAAHIVWGDEGFGMAPLEELEALIADSERWNSRHVNAGFVKIWLDGTPLPTVPTHAPLNADGSVAGDWLFVGEDELAAVIDRFDAAGKTVKVHCAGEGAVRVCLDAIARVRSGRPHGRPHEVAHAGFVAAEDYPRFADLDVTAEMSPALWHLPEAGLQGGFHFARMRDAGARMTIGSDWIVTSDPNLFPGIQGAVQHPSHPITLEEALAAVTRAGAAAVGADAARGMLRVGLAADLLVLDRDLFAGPIDAVGGTRVDATYVDGKCVYRRDS